MLSLLPSALLGALTLASSVSGASVLPRNATACNNSPSLCDKQYNQVTYMGAHDSAFLRDSSTQNSVAGNQYKNATLALDAGLRFLQAQVHDFNGTLSLCHTTCGTLNAGPLEEFLAKINVWVEAHPNDVVTILLVNSDEKPITDFGNAFESSGITKYGYNQTATQATGNWPTLQEMINANGRVVSFITNINHSTTYPYIRSEFDFIFETSYEVFSPSGFNCTLDRPSTQSSAASALSNNFMSLMNHFAEQTLFAGAYVPNVDAIETTNSASTAADGNLGKLIQDCTKEWGSKPNFVLVDFWDKGQVVQAVDTANGVTDAVGRLEVSSSAVTGLNKLALLTAVAGAVLLV